MNITQFATNLSLLEEGIWIPKHLSTVSYPKEGNRCCFQLEDNSFWFSHRNNCIIEVVKRFPPDGTIFDIGGGNGFVSSGLKKSGFDTIVVEPGIEGARNTKSRKLTPVICATLEDAGFRKNVLPAVGLFDVLEHIQDDTYFLQKIKSFLLKNGRIYITVPAYKFLWSTSDDRAGHYHRYQLRELTKKIEYIGYEIEYATYFFSFLILPIFLFRTLPDRLKVIRKSTFNEAKKEHTINKGIFSQILSGYLKAELGQIKKGKINFGASCLIVAKAI